MGHRFSVVLISVCVSLFVVNGSGAQSTDAAVIVDEFVKAWNSHDMNAFAELFADEAIWIPVAESRLKGRNSILKDFNLIHTTWAQATTVASSEVTVQTVRPDVATIAFRLGYVDREGNTVPEDRHAVLIVAVKHAGRWRIASGQITKKSCVGR